MKFTQVLPLQVRVYMWAIVMKGIHTPQTPEQEPQY